MVRHRKTTQSHSLMASPKRGRRSSENESWEDVADTTAPKRKSRSSKRSGSKRKKTTSSFVSSKSKATQKKKRARHKKDLLERMFS